MNISVLFVNNRPRLCATATLLVLVLGHIFYNRWDHNIYYQTRAHVSSSTYGWLVEYKLSLPVLIWTSRPNQSWNRQMNHIWTCKWRVKLMSCGGCGLWGCGPVYEPILDTSFRSQNLTKCYRSIVSPFPPPPPPPPPFQKREIHD